MIRSFSSIDEMFAAAEEDALHADKKVAPWQQGLTVGSFFCRMVDGVPIFCEVLDPAVPTWENPSDEDLEEIQESALVYEEEHMKNFRFCRAYSVYCPDGELGDVHVSTASFVLTQSDWLTAGELGWKLE